MLEDDTPDAYCYKLNYISAVTEVTNMERDIISGHSVIETMNRQYPYSINPYIFNKKRTYDIVKDYLYLYYAKTHSKNK